MIDASELEVFTGDCSRGYTAELPPIDATPVDQGYFEGLDHSLVEAIRDETGTPSITKLALLIGGYRHGVIMFDDHTSAILEHTEKASIGMEEKTGKYVGWGGYALVLSGAIYLESTQTN